MPDNDDMQRFDALLEAMATKPPLTGEPDEADSGGDESEE